MRRSSTTTLPGRSAGVTTAAPVPPWPRKGALLPDSDADVVVYDPEPEGTISAGALHCLAGYTPYEGLRVRVRGRGRATVSHGQVIYHEGRFTGRKGRGQFVARK